MIDVCLPEQIGRLLDPTIAANLTGTARESALALSRAYRAQLAGPPCGVRCNRVEMSLRDRETDGAASPQPRERLRRPFRLCRDNR